MNLKKRSGIREGTLCPLLEDTPEALYWMGFLLADGYFTDTQLYVALAKKDEKHLQILADFLGGIKLHDRDSKSRDMKVHKAVFLSLMHTDAMKKLKIKWGISNQKTYNPPNLSWLSEQQLIFVIIGFIDGDGHIVRSHRSSTEKVRVRFGNHGSWSKIIQLFSDTLHNIVKKQGPSVVITKRGVATLTMWDESVLRLLFSYAQTLPTLARKWNIIGRDYLSREEKLEKRNILITQLLHRGVKQVEIAKTVVMSDDNLSKTICRHKLREKPLNSSCS